MTTSRYRAGRTAEFATGQWCLLTEPAGNRRGCHQTKEMMVIAVVSESVWGGVYDSGASSA